MKVFHLEKFNLADSTVYKRALGSILPDHHQCGDRMFNIN